MTDQIEFEFKEGLNTQDNYSVSLKGFIELNEQVETAETLEIVKKECQNYISKIPLLDALDLIKADTSDQIFSTIKVKNENVTSFRIQTIDAADKVEPTKVEYEIDPALETQTQSKGILGKVKSIFKK